jgi:anti-anti-sigma factor
MDIAVEQLKGHAHLAIAGEMTIYGARELKERLLGVLETAQEIEIDLAQVSALDTAGFQLLVLAKRESLALGKPLRLTAHSRATREVLDLYHMMGYFGDPVVIPAAESPGQPPQGQRG